MYIIKHNHLKDAYHIQDYVKTLKKIDSKETTIEKPTKYIIEFE